MTLFNSKIELLGSGQIRSLVGDLTLRPDDTGLRDIITGSGQALRPEIDLGMDLGNVSIRWSSLYAADGIFTNKPTVGGSSIALESELLPTQTSINGLSGLVTLSSLNDGLIVNEVGQDIQLTSLFTSSSGAFVDAIQAQSGLYLLKSANLLDVENQRTSISNIGLDFVNGFSDRVSSTISIDEATRTFTIEPTVSGGSYTVWSNSTRFIKTSGESITWDNDNGRKFFYFDDDGNLAIRNSFNLNDLILVDAYISNLYWNATSGTVTIWGDERHGVNMDTATHVYLHTSFGARYISGGAIGNIITDGNGDLESSARISVSNTVIRDEDILLEITDGVNSTLSPIAQIPVLWREGASGVWYKSIENDYPFMYGGRVVESTGTLANYNEFTGGAWQLTELGNNDYALAHIFATNNVREGIISLVGQNTYNSSADARDGALTELAQIITEGLPVEEWVPLATLIIQTASSFDNIPKSRFISTDNGADYIDWRNTDLLRTGVGGSTATDHGALIGLTDDDHIQYLLVTGGRAATLLNITGTLSVDGLTHLNGGIVINGAATLNTDPTSGSGIMNRDYADTRYLQVGGGTTSKITRTFTTASGIEFVLQHGLNTEDFVYNIWDTSVDPQMTLIPDNVYPSGLNHAVIKFPLGAATSGKIMFVG